MAIGRLRIGSLLINSLLETCEICGESNWTEVYHGSVRDGVFGSLQNDATVSQCSGCGVQRLSESSCIPDSHYETGEYRVKLKQELDTQSYFSEHDHLQIHTIQNIPLPLLRNKIIADIGCAGGSFIDHVKGLAKKIIAVEPFQEYHQKLTERGYEVYSYANQAVSATKAQVDFAFSFQVIEHTANPRQFLEDIAPLLKPNGTLYLSTPNRNDILMGLLPDIYPSFFYRVVHRWYFDIKSLTECARLAGYEVSEVRYVHRYSMSNTLRWLRDRKPTGNTPIKGIEKVTDQHWKSQLEKLGTSDCLLIALKLSHTHSTTRKDIEKE